LVFKGNGKLNFVKPNGSDKRYGKGSHGSNIGSFLQLKNKYDIICSEIVGVNTWQFKSPKGVKKIVLTENSVWRGLMHVNVSRYE
jgi:hypothetical protein